MPNNQWIIRNLDDLLAKTRALEHEIKALRENVWRQEATYALAPTITLDEIQASSNEELGEKLLAVAAGIPSLLGSVRTAEAGQDDSIRERSKAQQPASDQALLAA